MKTEEKKIKEILAQCLGYNMREFNPDNISLEELEEKIKELGLNQNQIIENYEEEEKKKAEEEYKKYFAQEEDEEDEEDFGDERMNNPLFTDEEIEKEQRIFLRGMDNNDPSDNVGDCIMIEANERHSKIIEGIIKKLEELELWEYNDLDTRINKLSKIYKELK